MWRIGKECRPLCVEIPAVHPFELSDTVVSVEVQRQPDRGRVAKRGVTQGTLGSLHATVETMTSSDMSPQSSAWHSQAATLSHTEVRAAAMLQAGS